MSFIEQIKYSGLPHYLYRLDKKDPTGGISSQGFRFILKNLKSVRRVFLMAKHGSYSFYTLAKLRQELPCLENSRLYFLEVISNSNPYTWGIRARYQDMQYIKISTGSLTSMNLKLMWYKSLNIKEDLFLEPGGHIKYPQEIYKDDFFDIYNHLGKEVTHIMPILTGNLMDSLIYWSDEFGAKHKFIGVVTESFKSVSYFKKKYKNNKNIEIIPSEKIDYEKYLEEENSFFEETKIHLEPVNTVHLLDALKIRDIEKPVLWMTSPYIEN